MEKMRVDNSTLSTLGLCTTKALVRYHLHRAVPEAMAAAKAGQVIHKGVEAYFKSGFSVDKGMDALRQAWAEIYKPVCEEDDRLNLLNIEKIMWYWFMDNGPTRWPFEFYPDLVEMPFEVALNATGEVQYTGRIDTVVRAKNGNSWFILDTKTSGKPPTEYNTRDYILSSQLTGYIWAFQQIWPDKQISGAYINRIHVKEMPNSNYKCKTHGMVYSDCGSLHIEHKLCGPYTRSPEEIQNWRSDALDLAYKWAAVIKGWGNDIRSAPQEGRWQYDGCSRCEFLGFCASGRRNVENTTIRDEWSPLQ